MILAILSTFLQAAGDIFWKKSLGYGVGGKIHDLLGYPIGILIIAYFLYQGVDFGKVDPLFLGSVFVIISIAIYRTQLGQKIWREEKVSVLLPYTNLNKIFTIILSFFLFADVSRLSFAITLIAAVIVVLGSIDFKTLRFPKNFSLILFSESITAGLALGMGWAVKEYGQDLYFMTFFVYGALILLVLSWILGEYKTVKNLPATFWWNRAGGGICGWVAWFLMLTIMGELGLTITVLLSFLTTGFTLILSFLLLGDKPSAKDLLLTVVITALVGLGFYFK